MTPSPLPVRCAVRRVGGVAMLLALAACRSFEFASHEYDVQVPVPRADSVDAVVFLIGNAGEAIEGRSPVLERLRSEVESWSARLGRDSAVSVVFLGDNVYPAGVHDRGHPSFPQDSSHLWSQIGVVAGEAAQKHKTIGVFLPGNHDWGNIGGPESFGRITNLDSALARARATGPRVALVPPAGHPGPIVRDQGETVRLIFLDSHWFLRERSEVTRTIFLKNLRIALEGADDREVVMLAHHPFASAGPHGAVATGTRSMGLLYLLQRSGTLVHDLNSPAYGSLRNRLRITFQRTDEIPLVFAGAHDHSLQVLDGLQPGDPRTILVSGAGSKLTAIGDTVGLRYAAVRPGYMSLVFRTDQTVELFVTAGDPEATLCPVSSDGQLGECMRRGIESFRVVYSEKLPTERPDSVVAGPENEEALVDVAPPDSAENSTNELEETDPTPAAVPPRVLFPGRDTVVAAPGERYPAGPIRRLFMGDLNRHLWEIPFAVPVLDLDSVGGGLEPTELSGGKQTLGLRFQGKDGLIYQFRSIVKDASRALPAMVRSGPVDDAVQDQMAAQFPLGAVFVADLLESVGILVARPTAVVMPDDPRLGEYRELFAGRMGWIEVRPNEREGDEPGFAASRDVSDTAGMLEDLWADAEAFVNVREFVRARLIDMLVNDWDRHQDNWRWAKFDQEDGRERWDPIPRDRDWALARIDGLLPRLAGMYYPKYVGFDDEYPSIKRLMWAGGQTDRYLLGGVGRDLFIDEATALRQALTDSVIDAALQTLPPGYLAAEEERLRHALRERREDLLRVTNEFYELLAGWVDTYGTVDSDSVDLHITDDSVTIELWRGEDRLHGFTRTFVPGETNEVRLYLTSGEDVVSVSGGTGLPVRVRLIGEPAFVALMESDSARLLVTEGEVDGFDGLEFHHTLLPEPIDAAAEGEDQDPELPRAAVMAWDTRDWGSQWIASPAFEWETDVGLHGGVRLTRFGFGFRQDPWDSRLDVRGLYSHEPQRFIGGLSYEKRINLDGLSLRADLDARSLRYARFFGIGNDAPAEGDENLYELFRSHVRFDGSLIYQSPGESWTAWIGPRFERWGQLDEKESDPTILAARSVYGSEKYVQVGVQGGLTIDGRDELDMPIEGGLFRLQGRAFPAAADLRAPHGGLQASLRTFWALPGPMDAALHVALYGERTWGDPPWPDRARLGGAESLAGYPTFRFLGDNSASISALLRASLLRLGLAGGIRLGAHAIGTGGRVWLDGVADSGQRGHFGVGGGLFARFDAFERSLVVSFVRGADRWRTILGIGFPF